MIYKAFKTTFKVSKSFPNFHFSGQSKIYEGLVLS